MTHTFNGIDEPRVAVGEYMGYDNWHQVTEEAVNQFGKVTGEYQWIHVDSERAKSSSSDGIIAHSHITLPWVPLIWQIYQIKGVTMNINCESNKMLFQTSVSLRSRVRVGVNLASVKPSSLGFTMATRVTITIKGSDKLACVAKTLSMVVP